ncbi:MAG: transcriptional regulator [Desulfuromonas sp. SDB]|nr:MAG: transcriptional regulator [Desulfuromonas sp. SDB]
MSGHSKWSTIKRKKAKVDAKRGKIFTKIIKEITIAAKQGGGDPEGNPRLRSAILEAKSANMPQDNIDRAIKKGTGDLPGVSYEEVSYEGYGPEGVAVLVDVVTDNKNRTTAELKHIFSKNGGSIGSPNCVAWMFDRKGVIAVSAKPEEEDQIMEVAMEEGAEDIYPVDDGFEIYTSVEDFIRIKEDLESKINISSAELSMIPKNPTEQKDTGKAGKILKFLESLEDHDDVQNVYANVDIPEEILNKIE